MKGRSRSTSRATARRTRAVDRHRRGGVEERLEEAEPLDVVEMQVRQEEVEVLDAVGDDRLAQRAGARAGVQHHRPAGRRAHVDARRVAPVAHRGGARCRERAPAAPDRRLHRRRRLRGADAGDRDGLGRGPAAGVAEHGVQERLPIEREEGRVGPRTHGGRSGHVAEEGDLADERRRRLDLRSPGSSISSEPRTRM